jgi:hypothetical protein
MGASQSTDSLKNDEALLLEKLKKTPTNAKKNNSNNIITQSLYDNLKALYSKDSTNFHYIICCIIKNKLSDEDLEYFSSTFMPKLTKTVGGQNAAQASSANAQAAKKANAAKAKAAANAAKAAANAAKAAANAAKAAQVAKKAEAKKNEEKSIEELKTNIRILKVLVSNYAFINNKIAKILAK